MIPRAVRHLFNTIEEARAAALEKNEPSPQFEVTAQFLELYNEELIDLFDSSSREMGKKLRIHEDLGGGMYVAGATTLKVESEEETLTCLKQGALLRSVGSTNMNAQSSRSHAIFTLNIVQQRPCKMPASTEGGEGDSGSRSSSTEVSDWESLSGKFHFVDLAGSERLKRTGATGERAKEGISINCGLLALGNVISALGDKAKKGSHVPYRDSKLTRLLQDSLGGNSRTLMIACISPTDRDFMETLNTLKYANRARNIKNKVMVNQDKTSQQLGALRAKIQELEVELQEFRSGRVVISEDGSLVMNDMANEITMLRTDNDKLRLRVKVLQQVIDSQSERMAAMAADREVAILGHQDESTGQVVAEGGGADHGKGNEQQLSTVIQGYMKEIEDLKSRLMMSESLAHHSPGSPFRRAPSTVSRGRFGSTSTVPFNHETEDLLQHAKIDIQRLREIEERKASTSELASPSRHHGRRHPPSRGMSNLLLERMMSEPTLEKPVATAFESDEEDSNSSNEDDSSDEDDVTLPKSISSDEDSEDEDEDETASLASSIAELSSEINLKQQLVDQLEKAQKNLMSMKHQYEDKMNLLQRQIKSVESERDKVLKEMGARRGVEKREENVKAIKSTYEKQLGELKLELKSLKTARKEHAKAMRKNAQHEKELQRLKTDLLEMKKNRVKLLNRMRTEAAQKKTDDTKKAREVAQIRKEGRKKELRIKSLEADGKRRELVLRRRQEELQLLRRRNRFSPSKSQSSASIATSTPSAITLTTPTSTSAASINVVMVTSKQQRPVTLQPPPRRDKLSRRMSSVFSSDNAKRRWREFERKITNSILNRKTMQSLSKDMDQWIEKRDALSRKKENVLRQREEALKRENVDAEELGSIDEDLDSIAAHVDYVQENIQELQSELIAVDDSKNDSDTLEAHSIIASCSVREAKYLLEHLLDMVLAVGVKAALNESEVRALKARLEASEQSAELMKSFSSPQVSYPFVVNHRTVTKLNEGVASSGAPPPPLDLTADSSSTSSDDSGNSDHLATKPPLPPPPTQSEPSKQDAVKLRRRTALPSELKAGRQRQFSDPPVRGTESAEVLESPDGESSPVATGDSDGQSPRVRRGSSGPFDAKTKKLKKRSPTTNSLDLSTYSSNAATSPGSARRALRSTAYSESNVWARLSGTSQDASSDTSKGSLQAVRTEARKSSAKQSLLNCTHTACGHHASVLSLCATQTLLFSASQDRTVKVWDLRSGSELLTLDKHFSYVRAVRYCPKNKLIFTASQGLIKVWDLRNYRAKSIKTFGPPAGSGSSSETVVQDLLVSPTGDTLFSASGSTTNIWDLRRFMLCGRLVGHNGAVCALTITGNQVATGSRDRLIKLFDLEACNTKDSSPTTSQAPLCTLYPPHYDAVSSFATYGDLLFSSCGVTIKQWDTKERALKLAIDGAHSQGNVINSLGTLPSPLTPLLVSGCKGGLIKLWNPESCGNIGEVAAHKAAINSIATNDTCVFTGSSDKTIKIWRPSPSFDS